MRAYDDGPIAQYAAQALGTPLLSASEEVELAREVRREAELLAAGRIGPGDRPARDRMYRANLRLVVGAARGFVGRGVELEDLIQEGNVALGEAVDSYDVDRPNLRNPGSPVRFATHAMWALRGRLSRVVHLRNRCRMLNSDDLPDVATDGGPGQDERPDPAAKVEELMACLDDRERRVVSMRHGIGIDRRLRNREIAPLFHVTSNRIQQIDARALAKMAEREGCPRTKIPRRTCPNGHPISDANAYGDPHPGEIRCRECRRRAAMRHADAAGRGEQTA